jgi:hypothetical protein
MIHHRHIEELDNAVRVARRAVTAQHVDDADRLSRVLHERWYLGLSSQQPEVPAPTGRTWQAWGRLWTAETGDRGSGLVRLHLSVAPRTALHVFGVVTQRAHTWQHPWRLTSTALDTALPTPEATVLQVPTDSLRSLRREIAAMVDDLRPFLALGVPALTLSIGRGASLSANPADGRTFGEHRCALVARAVLASMQCHPREQVSRTMVMFAEAGVDPERPYSERSTTWDRPWRIAS